MKTIRPWNKESERVLNQIAKDGKAYTTNMQFTRAFGRKHPTIFDKNNGYLDIARIDKRGESVILPRSDIRLIPLHDRPGEAVKLQFKKKYGFVRIF
jgi:hypothetical protein